MAIGRRSAALALAGSLALPGLAEAARLTTPIVSNNDWAADCRLGYFGLRRDIPVKLTFVGYADQPGSEVRTIKTFKMGPANRGVQLHRTCDAVGGDLACEAFRCVFEVPNGISLHDFVGNACGSEDVNGRYCQAGVMR